MEEIRETHLVYSLLFPPVFGCGKLVVRAIDVKLPGPQEAPVARPTQSACDRLRGRETNAHERVVVVRRLLPVSRGRVVALVLESLLEVVERGLLLGREVTQVACEECASRQALELRGQGG